ncbi:helix-turn-helix transcriptional regulator [Methylobacterium sp. NMS12]|uniref:helix-turn-helix domain-containing protein n=1 Tax=Methylobacterium sp. NMS12 TaxID=3079766 RepID=UPI003F882C3A
MAEISPAALADTLRAAMAKRSVKLTDLAQLTGVPYRSLQNYLTRKTDMPASVYLKICAQLGLDPFYVAAEKSALDYRALRGALVNALGQHLPTHEFDEKGEMHLVPYAGPERDRADLWRDAGTVAHFVAAEYDRDSEAQLHQPLLGDE